MGCPTLILPAGYLGDNSPTCVALLNCLPLTNNVLHKSDLVCSCSAVVWCVPPDNVVNNHPWGAPLRGLFRQLLPLIHAHDDGVHELSQRYFQVFDPTAQSLHYTIDSPPDDEPLVRFSLSWDISPSFWVSLISNICYPSVCRNTDRALSSCESFPPPRIQFLILFLCFHAPVQHSCERNYCFRLYLESERIYASVSNGPTARNVFPVLVKKATFWPRLWLFDATSAAC